VDALEHENCFLRAKIREAGELVSARDADLAALQVKARSRIDELNGEIQQLQARMQEQGGQLRSSEAQGRRVESLLRDVQAVGESSEALRDSLQDSDKAHVCTQGYLRAALQQLELAREQLAQLEAQLMALRAELSAAQLAHSLEAAGSTAVIKAKESAFYQTQLQRVHARMTEQEQELQLSTRAQRSIAAALTVQECSAAKKDEVLAAALATNAQLEASFRKQMAARDAALRALQQSAAGGSAASPAPPPAPEPAPAVSRGAVSR